MDPSVTPRGRRSLVMLFGAVLVLVGAGMAAARTQSGPPWAQDSAECETAAGAVEATTLLFATGSTVAGTSLEATEDCQAEDADPEQVRADVEEFFAAFANECGAEVLGESDLGDQATLDAFDALTEGLESGQTSHMVQSVRVLLDNCAAHANEGLRNALYHHGLNWLRHHEHELWLQEKFAAKWPGGKHGNPHETHGNPHETQGSPHTSSANGGPGNGAGNGNAYGHFN